MPASDSQPPCRVAICDDVADFRTVLGVVLGLDPMLELVGEAANGEEAVAMVRHNDVDVLLLDVSMPVMDGLEALPLVLAASPDTQVVMLTGFGSVGTRATALELGAARYIEKGVTPDSILAVVRELHAARTSR